MTTASLRQAFKTLADPTRMRVLALLEREEMAVQELMEVLGMAQSTVSRHLAILREAGLLDDRRAGTFVYYRFRQPNDLAWRETWGLTKRQLEHDATVARDRAALESIVVARATRTRAWFDAVAPEWDSLRRVFHDDVARARAIARLVPDGMAVADVGTGTGVLALELARQGLRVIAVDHSPRMLDAARQKLLAGGVQAKVELRQGDASRLPLADGEVQAVFAHMVLHYVASPVEAVREMARVVCHGGKIVIVDFIEHDRDWMKDKLGVQWQGFPLTAVHGWFASAGLADLGVEVNEPPAKGQDLPQTFIATASKPTVS